MFEQLFINALVVLFAFSLAYWLKFFQLPSEVPCSHFLSFKYVLGAFFLFIAIQLLLLPVLGLTLMALKTGSWTYTSIGMPGRGWIYVIDITVVALGMLGYLHLLLPEQRERVWNKGSKINQIRQFAFGALIWLLAYPTVNLVTHLSDLSLNYFYGDAPIEYQTSAMALIASRKYPALFAVMALQIVFLVPIIEELLFRGLMQTWLKNYVNRLLAIGISSLIFAFFHYSPEQGVANIEFIISLFVLSCFLGFLYERQNSLWAPIGLHAVFNAISVIILISK